MDTHFASPERSDRDQLFQELALIGKNPLVDGLMRLVPGFFVVLNRHRQILVINDAMLAMLEAGSAHEVLGLRPGEAVHCIHSNEMRAGCGTSEFCATCGAAIAIVAALSEDAPAERECAITFHRAGRQEYLYLSVRCVPFALKKERFLLVFLQDITACRKMAFLTRSFLHDISNTVAGLTGLTQLYENSDRPLDPARNRDLFGRISNLSLRLAREIEVHRYLIGREQSMYKSEWEPVSVLEILKEIGDTFARHPATRDKHLVFPEPCEMLNLIFATDRFLLLRILSNMVVNALEASEPGDTVRISVSRSLDRLTFSVWNRAFIMPKFARRVFERDFTTKPEAGRGMGTYTMKRFGEESLGGTVDFMTSPVEGTTFSFTIPI